MAVSRQFVPERFLALQREASPVLRALSPDLSLEQAKVAIVAGILAERAAVLAIAQPAKKVIPPMFLIFQPKCSLCANRYKAEAAGPTDLAGEYHVRCPRCFTNAVVTAAEGVQTNVGTPWAVRAVAA